MADLEGSEVAVQNQKPAQDRRRARLPQPDFTHYQRANAYPGVDYFFVGHSYHVDDCAADQTRETNRANAIKALFEEQTQWMAVQTALANQDLLAVLSRCERDLLHHLPESAVIGPAIDGQGKIISQSFTVWRKEMRRQSAS